MMKQDMLHKVVCVKFEDLTQALNGIDLETEESVTFRIPSTSVFDEVEVELFKDGVTVSLARDKTVNAYEQMSDVSKTNILKCVAKYVHIQD